MDLLSVISHNPMLAGGAGLGLFGGLMAWARNVPKVVGEFIFRETTSSVQVNNEDGAFLWFKKWLEDHPYSKKSRNVIATIGHGERNDLAIAQARLKYTPAFGGHAFFYKGRFIWLTRNREKPSQDVATQQQKSYETITVRVLGRSKQILLDLCSEIEHLGAKEREEGFIDLYVNRYGYWNFVRKRKARGLESVILDNNVGTVLLEDMKKFLTDGVWYDEKGIPHRRGYLFYGVPGSGKSSLSLALAGELSMDIYILTLAEKNLTDSDLMRLMQTVKRRSLVLLEDVDAIFVDRQKKTGDEAETSDGVTFSGLLNALDGVASKEGIVTVMSTNHIEKLDPALIRPGRADVKVEFFNASVDQLIALFTRFFPDASGKAQTFAQSVGHRTVSMSAAQEHLLRYRGDPEKAIANIRELQPASSTGPVDVPVVPKSLPCATTPLEVVQ